MKRNNQPPRLRRLIAILGAVLATLALAFTGVLGMGVVEAAADEYSDAVNKRDSNKNKVADLRNELTGIDSELADLFIAVEETRGDVEQAESDLAAAEDELESAERFHQQVLKELEDATRELGTLQKDIQKSEADEVALSMAVGDMARDLYRGGAPEPFEVIVSKTGVSGISQRTAAATSLSRVQDRALEQVRSNLVVKENQELKQQAVTERVTELEAEAEEAKDEAQRLRDDVSDQLGTLKAKLADQEAAQTEWEGRKSEAEGQLKEANAAIRKAEADIAKIDQQNRSGQVSYGSSSRAPSGGKIFVSPFKMHVPITSPFGYRIHPVLGVSMLHGGLDLGAGCGTTQYPGRDGVVVQTGYNDVSGNLVTINHGMVNGQSWITEHFHLSSISVSPGQRVTTDTPIGTTGTTGRSTGCHLHWVLYRNGALSDIYPYTSF